LRGRVVKHNNFTVYPEYCGCSEEQLASRSKMDERYHIASVLQGSKNVVMVFHKGTMIYSRAKCHLYPGESAVEEGKPRPEIVLLGDTFVLILICYEIIFPEDYLPLMRDGADLVVHIVGYPMTDENQREGWIALHKCLSLVFDCPVVCCCGGEEGRMNISGITEC